jgi:hypothetical protein
MWKEVLSAVAVRTNTAGGKALGTFTIAQRSSRSEAVWNFFAIIITLN